MTECPGFAPSLWQPRKCIHCFKQHGTFRNNPPINPINEITIQPNPKEVRQLQRTNSNKNLPIQSNDELCIYFTPQKWRPNVCLNCFASLPSHTPTHSPPLTPRGEDQLPPQQHSTSLSFSTLSTSLGRAFNASEVTISSTIPDSIPIVQTYSPSYLPNVQEVSMVVSQVVEEFSDEDDPFKDFEELDDTPLPTSLNNNNGAAEEATAACNGTSFRYTESEEEWEEGVDFSSILSNGQYSYVNNKISEIASVREEMERTQHDFEANPYLVLALGEVLQAKQQQIQLAFERDKIDQQDHTRLLESLTEVRTMLLHHGRTTSLC